MKNMVSIGFSVGFMVRSSEQPEYRAFVRNKLQYIYSISVFFGVLLISYVMIHREINARITLPSVPGNSNRMDASPVVDPVVNQLFEVESALSRVPVPKTKEEKRKITEADDGK